MIKILNTYFKFPKDPEIKKVWINACGKENVNFKSGTIFSKHFTDNDWRLKDKLMNISLNKRLLDPKAVPTLNVHVNRISVERSQRILKRTAKQNVREAIAEFDLNQREKLQDINNRDENIESENPNYVS